MKNEVAVVYQGVRWTREELRKRRERREQAYANERQFHDKRMATYNVVERRLDEEEAKRRFDHGDIVSWNEDKRQDRFVVISRLVASSTYEQVVDPSAAVMITNGTNLFKVPVWQLTKVGSLIADVNKNGTPAAATAPPLRTFADSPRVVNNPPKVRK